MLLAVDGYNILHSIPRYGRLLERNAAEARAVLIRDLGKLAAAKSGNVQIHVFFDSRRMPDHLGNLDPHLPGVEIHYADMTTADEAIVDFVYANAGKGPVTVATDDRRLASQARDEGAQTISSSDLEHRLDKAGG